MKKTDVMTGIALAMVCLAPPAGAGFVSMPDRGDAQQKILDVISVALTLSLRDQTPVVLEGYISRQIGSRSYIFRDVTGSIVANIEEECWPDRPVTPGDRVRLEGRVDREWLAVSLDVLTVKLLAP